MKRIKCIVSYDGTNYHGFAKQKNACTVQQILEEAFFTILRHPVQVVGAGRTDTGVHAKGQCCIVDTDKEIALRRLLKGVNSQLPKDIVIREMEEVPDDFHPQYLAKRKTYRYQILNGETPDPFWYKYAYFYPYFLDGDKMQEAATYLVGEHDFKAFCSAGSTVTSTVRTIYSIEFKKVEDRIQIDVCGNGFLYNMVRIIVGTLIEVGRGKIKPESIKEMLSTGKRELAGPTAPPQGLMMLNIEYV
jgi:tRNA pseudouridine38-40 synthase